MSFLAIYFLVFLCVILFIPICYGVMKRVSVVTVTRNDVIALGSFLVKTIVVFAAFIFIDITLQDSEHDFIKNKDEYVITQEEKVYRTDHSEENETNTFLLLSWLK